MTLNPFLRKLGLTAHITFSVGWFGSVLAFFVLAITGLTSLDSQLIRSSYLSMDLLTWFIILPFCFGSLVTGITQSVGTQWGLFKHYWVAVKLIMTIISTIILIAHMQPISYLADVAASDVLSYSELRGLRTRLIFDAGAALLVLIVAITLSVYKPWGKTPYGLRGKSTKMVEGRVRPWGLYLLLGLISIIILLFIATHLIGGGLSHH